MWGKRIRLPDSIFVCCLPLNDQRETDDTEKEVATITIDARSDHKNVKQMISDLKMDEDLDEGNQEHE